MRVLPVVLLAALLASAWPVRAEEIGCVTTEWKLLGANHKVCVNAFTDPEIPCVTCYMSQARTGGVSGAVGLAEDPSEFSLDCRQTCPSPCPQSSTREGRSSRKAPRSFQGHPGHRLLSTRSATP